MNLLYWCPYLSKVATVQAVLNSATSVKEYSKKNLNPQILNIVGEWNEHEDYIKSKGIQLINLINSRTFYSKLPRNSFIKSRISYLLISCVSFLKLYRFLKSKNETDIFIIHLISALPLILLILFNFKCKFVLRISGYPKLNIFRNFLWKFSNKKLSAITCPTEDTHDYLINNKIFDKKKCYVLNDPILEVSKFNILTKEKLESNLENKKYILNIGRFVDQKNQIFLIKAFKKILEIDKNFFLVILGNGELEKKLKALTIKLDIDKNILFLGHVQNVFKYLKHAKYFVLTSKWEDPGFVLLEAAFSKTSIISSDCPNGPREILNNGSGGFIFESNNLDDFLRIFKQAEMTNEEKKDKKKKEVLKKAMHYTKFRHFKSLNRIIGSLEV